ncbi:hypothetical protein J6590_031728 [Homalodisca vitripennis]|nr:hypothetical protein J6590_031728 [Homalodisca vitripennis]
MAGQAGRLQGQDRSAVTCPSSSHARLICNIGKKVVCLPLRVGRRLFVVVLLP